MVHQVQQLPAVAADQFRRLIVVGFVTCGKVFFQRFHHTQNDRKRRTELMADIGKKPAFEGIQLLQALGFFFGQLALQLKAIEGKTAPQQGTCSEQ